MKKPIPIDHKDSRISSILASILTPSVFNTSAEPDLDDIARLPCFATGTPQPAATNAAHVDMFNVPIPSPPVPAVSIAFGGASIVIALSRMAIAAPAISSTVSPRTLIPIKRAPIWLGVDSPDITISNAVLASVLLKLAPVASLASNGGRLGIDQSALLMRAISRKLANKSCPFSDAILSG